MVIISHFFMGFHTLHTFHTLNAILSNVFFQFQHEGCLKVCIQAGKFNDYIFTLRKIPWKFCVEISIRNVPRRWRSRSGVLGGCWGFLTWDMDDRVIPDVISDVLLPQGRYPENFVLISQLEVFREGGGQKVGYLEDVEGSWPKTWMIESFLMFF